MDMSTKGQIEASESREQIVTAKRRGLEDIRRTVVLHPGGAPPMFLTVCLSLSRDLQPSLECWWNSSH